jgi:hypothetical protein
MLQAAPVVTSAPSLQKRLERLTPEQRSHVARVVAGLEQVGALRSGQPRQPGGLQGAMHTHDDFDAPLDETFLQP